VTAFPRVGMDPRIRERRIAVQRALGRRRLRLLLIGAGLVIAAGVTFLVVHSPLLDVDRVHVRGAQHVTAAEVRKAAHVSLHQPLMFLDTGAIVRRVEDLPWVEHASVQRVYPGTVRILVTEYAPTSYVRAGNGFVLLASNGRAIAITKAVPAGVLEVRGVRRAPALHELLSPPEATDVVAQLPADLAQRVAAIDLANAGIAVDLNSGGAIRFGDATNLAAKGSAALAVLTQNNRAPFAYIDVSTPNTPVLHR
jgi:cell division protein FtsQ